MGSTIALTGAYGISTLNGMLLHASLWVGIGTLLGVPTLYGVMTPDTPIGYTP